MSAPAPLPQAVRRAIAALGVTQIIGWGSTYYLLTILAVPIRTELNLPAGVVAGGLSILLAVSALLGPIAGRMMDMHGARPVMATGSVISAIGLAFLSQVQSLSGYALAWIVLGVSASMILYPAAFTALTQLAPHSARRAITWVTLPGGLASTIFWPLTTALLDHMDWRTICLVYASLNLAICLPLHLLALPGGEHAESAQSEAVTPIVGLPTFARKRAFWLFTSMLAFNSLLVTGLLNQFIIVMTGLGFEADVAVLCGMLFGISQLSARLTEMLSGSKVEALAGTLGICAAYVVSLFILAVGRPHAAAGIVFAMLFGAANGLLTIGRGALILSLFGSNGYGEMTGKVIVAQGITGALAPIIMASVVSHSGASTALGFMALVANGSLVAMLLLFRHATASATPPDR